MSEADNITLLGMGNPLLDISAVIGQDLLDKYDVKLDSAILAEDKHQPLYQELVKNYKVEYIAGGATQNAIRVAQWMLTSAGATKKTAFMGCVGNDDYGKQLETCASGDGVLVHYMKDAETPTGTCAALIKDGERALVANLAAANNFKPTHLETDLAKKLVEKAQFYYIAGFFLTVSVESLVQVAEHAVAQNKLFCMNLSAPFIVQFFKTQLDTALPYTDYIFGNEGEAETFGKTYPELVPEADAGDLSKVALALAASPKKNSQRSRVVVFTQGSKSTLVAMDGKVQEFPVDPMPKDQLVDTNGAGDAFVGGFMAQLVQGKDLKTCVEAGHWAARYVIQQSGTQLVGPCEYK